MPTRKAVILNATISGGEKRVNCKIRAIETTLSPSIPPVFSNYEVIDTPETVQLPDGNYEISVNGEQIPVSKQSGAFLARA